MTGVEVPWLLYFGLLPPYILSSAFRLFIHLVLFYLLNSTSDYSQILSHEQMFGLTNDETRVGNEQKKHRNTKAPLVICFVTRNLYIQSNSCSPVYKLRYLNCNIPASLILSAGTAAWRNWAYWPGPQRVATHHSSVSL